MHPRPLFKPNSLLMSEWYWQLAISAPYIAVHNFTPVFLYVCDLLYLSLLCKFTTSLVTEGQGTKLFKMVTVHISYDANVTQIQSCLPQNDILALLYTSCFTTDCQKVHENVLYRHLCFQQPVLLQADIRTCPT